MRFRSRFSLALLLVVFASGISSAATEPSQNSTPRNTAGSIQPSSAGESISLGRAAVPLYKHWKFTTGDSPIDPQTGRPLWAEPGFDDSHWEDVNLTPAEGAQNPITGTSGYVPGWTAKGHPNYWGYAWYRIRVRVSSEPGVSFALAGPAVDDAYQIYDNGTYSGHFGEFLPHGFRLYYSQPVMFELPSASIDSAGQSTHVLAFRVYMQPSTLYQGSGVGGFEAAPVIGESSAIALVHQSHRNQLIRTYLWEPIEAVVFFLLGLLAFSLAFFDRSDRVYLWIGALLLITAIDATSGALAVWTTYIDARYDLVSHNYVLFSLEYASWVMIWRVWFRQKRPTWMPWALIPLILILCVAQALSENFFSATAGTAFTSIGHTVSLLLRLTLAGFLLFIVVKAIREQGIEGWLVLPAVLLESAAEFSHEISVLGSRASWFPFGVQITLPVASHLILVLVLTVLLVRRLILSLRRQRILALDVKQAQEVQRVILPEARTMVPGLSIESIYRPAREVGGDFFQVMAHPTDGSVLIVAGDVAGKGLQAGMLVALLVGAIRSTAEATADPLSLIQALNRRLIGRGEAHATCLALRIAATGSVALANAGHLPPYLNGNPIAMEGALPLGSFEEAEFSVTHFQLQPNDRLVLVSDGLAEAMNPQGELFGFPRVQELVQTGISASDLANAVQTFGQEDDISIIALTRTASAIA
ncbi:MAG TPA: PP2C family protein-serine/threonine phosphatase [Terracidiphilus sp.]|nr:PP2C family protein-serine/threonine phosphatase [Terracidiphilus sp.]